MKSSPIPLRVPDDLMAEVEEATKITHMSAQDVMRLAMRIGLVDLRATKEIAGILQQVATDKGQSFLAWARQQQSPSIVEDTITAAGQTLRLLSNKDSLSGGSENAQAKSESCPPKESAPPATSTATAPTRNRTRKKSATVAQLPTTHWQTSGSDSTATRVAEEAPHASSSETPKENRA